MNTLSEAQKNHYGTLWTTADADRDNVIGIQDAAAFFHLSGLSQDVLGNIWTQVSPQGTPLTPDQFVYYCELISMAQNHATPNLQELMRIKSTGAPIPFPSFSGASQQSTPVQSFGSPVVQPSPVVDPYSHLVANAQELHGWGDNFNQLDSAGSGFVGGAQALQFFSQSGLTQMTLGQIWDLADVNKDGRLDVFEFCVAMFFIGEINKGHQLPPALPESLRQSIWNAGSQATANPQGSQASAGATPTGPFAVTADELATDTSIFNQNNILGFIEGASAVNLFSPSGVPVDQLAVIYGVADIDKDGKLSQTEFLVAMKLVRAKLAGNPIPQSVPAETLASINKPASSGAAQSSAPQNSNQIYEQRINDLQDRCNKADNEIASLKVKLQNTQSEKDKAESQRIEFESRASQAEARASALGSKSEQDTSAALLKINDLSNQLSQAFQKIDQLQSQNSGLEVKLQQANAQLQTAQSQLQSAQHQISVSANAFSAPSTTQVPTSTPSSPWGAASSSSASTSLPPPIASPSHTSSYSAFSSSGTHQPSPFSAQHSPAPSSAFTSSASSPFGTPAPSNLASSQPQNPFLMGMNF